MLMNRNTNESMRQMWLKNALSALPVGAKILDVGAEELKNFEYCAHLNYTSQDFCQYKGLQDYKSAEGLLVNLWDTQGIDLVSDICHIPADDSSFDAILCGEVLEHVPDPVAAIQEFSRLLRAGGILILTAPFSAIVHMAPYHFYTGFTKYWYQHHLPNNGFCMQTLDANGDWHSLLSQELSRLGSLERQAGNWSWPLAYLYFYLGRLFFNILSNKKMTDLACFGFHCIAVKSAAQ